MGGSKIFIPPPPILGLAGATLGLQLGTNGLWQPMDEAAIATGGSVSGILSGSGAGLTALNASQLAFGTVSDSRLSSSVPFLYGTNFFTGTNNFAGVAIVTNANNQFTGTFSGNGTGLTGLSVPVANLVGTLTPAQIPALDASKITTGTVSDSRLSANIPKLDANNTFVGTLTATSFSGNGAVPVQVVSGTSQTASPNTAYLLNNPGSTLVTLPTTANVGDVVRVSGLGAGDWRIEPASGQTITGSEPPVSWTARESSRNWVSVTCSADGTKLVAAVYGGQLYSSANSGVTWTARESGRNWYSVASSSDGTKLVAAVYDGQLYSSADSGVTWTARESSRNWVSVTCSADGTKLVAAVYGGYLYTSADSGATWTVGGDNRNWYSIASSADGTKLVAAVNGAPLYTSADSGTTWTQRESSRNWYSVASSADGTKLVAAVSGGQLYTSGNSGATWATRESGRNWSSVASSFDGNRLVAVVDGGQIYSAVGTVLGNAGAEAVLRFAGDGRWQPPNSSIWNLTETQPYDVRADGKSVLRITPEAFEVSANGNNVIRITPAGNVGIGGISQILYKLHVNGGVAGTSAYVNTSDARYKTNVVTLNGALERVLSLRGVEFDWKRDEFPALNFETSHQLGFIAQELKQVLPEAVSIDKEGVHSVAYSKVVPVLVEALKEQKRLTDAALKAKDAELESLKQDLAALKKLVESLAAQSKGGAK